VNDSKEPIEYARPESLVEVTWQQWVGRAVLLAILLFAIVMIWVIWFAPFDYLKGFD